MWRVPCYTISPFLFSFKISVLKMNNPVISLDSSNKRRKGPGKKIAKEGGKTMGDMRGNRKRTKNARSLTARAESQSPRFVELALAELSVRWSASKSSFSPTDGWTRTPAMVIDDFRPLVSRTRRNGNLNKNNSSLLLSVPEISDSFPSANFRHAADKLRLRVCEMYLYQTNLKLSFS